MSSVRRSSAVARSYSSAESALNIAGEGKENPFQERENNPGSNLERKLDSRVGRRRPLQDAGNVPRPAVPQKVEKWSERSVQLERKPAPEPDESRSFLSPRRGARGKASHQHAAERSTGSDTIPNVTEYDLCSDRRAYISETASLVAPSVLDISDEQVPEPEIVPKAVPSGETDPLFYEPLVSFAEQDMGMGVSQEHRLIYQDLDTLSPGAPQRFSPPPLSLIDPVNFVDEEPWSLPRAVFPSPHAQRRRLAALTAPLRHIRQRRRVQRDES